MLVSRQAILLALLGATNAFAPSRTRKTILTRQHRQSSNPLFVGYIGLGPQKEEDTEVGEEDDEEEVEAEVLEIPDHELYRLARRTLFDEECDEWFEKLLGEEYGFLGEVSKKAREALLTPVELVNDIEKDYDDEEWTPYVQTKLPTSPLYPAYGLEKFGLPVPRRGAEAWRLFEIAGMINTDYSQPVEGVGSNLELSEEQVDQYKESLMENGAWVDDDKLTARLVYVNGRFCPQLSKTTDEIYNIETSDFDTNSIPEKLIKQLNHLTDGFTDELAAPVPNGEDEFLTSYKKLSGPNHNVGEPTSQFAINGQQGTACFVALNSCKTGCVAHINVPAGQYEEKPVMLVNAVTKDGGANAEQDAKIGVSCHPRALVNVGDESKLSLVQSCVDLDNGSEAKCPKLYNGYTQIYVGAGGNLTHSYLEESGGIVTPGVETKGEEDDGRELAPREEEAKRPELRDTHLEAIDVQLVGDKGSYSGTVMAVGGSGRARIALSTSLLRPGSNCDVSGFGLAGGAQKQDMRTNIHLVAQGCTNRQQQKNMVGGRATATFRGRIRVEQSAQQTDSDQLSRTILLSDKARIWATPSLEIIADDIACTHGLTVADLSEEELFYLRSRGLDRTMSRNILMYAFANAISGRVDPVMLGTLGKSTGLQARVIRRLQNVVPKGDREVMGEFQSV